MSDVGPTGGGDFPEAYEYALRECRRSPTWRAANKAIVMIGDAVPHEPNENPEHIDWSLELEHLNDRQVQIFAVQCLSGSRTTDAFYSTCARVTNGYHLRLTQFAYVRDLILAVCFRQLDVSRLAEFETELQSRAGGINSQVREMFDVMLGRSARVRDVPAAARTTPDARAAPTAHAASSSAAHAASSSGRACRIVVRPGAVPPGEVPDIHANPRHVGVGVLSRDGDNVSGRSGVL